MKLRALVVVALHAADLAKDVKEHHVRKATVSLDELTYNRNDTNMGSRGINSNSAQCGNATYGMELGVRVPKLCEKRKVYNVKKEFKAFGRNVEFEAPQCLWMMKFKPPHQHG